MDKDERTELTKENICNLLKSGLFKKDAAIRAGIDESTFYRWIQLDASFASRVEASIIEYKHTLIKNVNACAVTDGKLALEVLKRRFPKEWDGSQDYEEKEKYEGSTREVADLLQKIFNEGNEARRVSSQNGELKPEAVVPQLH